jgi:predicted RNase H-like HicB family nuclease
MTTMELNARVHHEDGAYWAEVLELPGCFASGRTLDELTEALHEAIATWLDDGARAAEGLEVSQLTLAPPA